MAPPSAIEVSAETDTSGITIPNPLTAPITSNDIFGRRKKALQSQWGIAAASDTANFRQKSYENKPKAKRWEREFSPVEFVLHGDCIADALVQTF
jgi:aromatic amino acid aminotransferase I